MKLQTIYQILTTVALLCLLGVQGFSQGVTTTSVNGQITDTGSQPLIGANVSAVHVPSGTFYGTSTDEGGYYRIPNMRVGGPYKITVTYTGFQEKEYNDVFLRLGEPMKLNVSLEEGAIELATIMVTAKGGTSGQTAGASTQITEDDINMMPTLDRNLNDFTRLTPQSKPTFGGGFSLAGINNRYNAIYIDGAVNNDVFGLAASGTNGGQTGISPFSIDAIEQIQVVISPYDVSLGGFAGGGINAVTKSGTNELRGTAYYFMQNENLAGKTNATLTSRTGSSREKLAEFSNTLYGLSLGGPIVKDKIFFFVNAELEDNQTPVPYDFGTYLGDASISDLDALRNHLINNYGYDPGNYLGKTDRLEGVKLFGKLDFNLPGNNQLTLRHQYTKAEQTDVNGSSSTAIQFENNGVFFPSVTNSTAVELSSQIGTNFSNNLVIGLTTVRDDRDPIGSDFPYLDIDDVRGSILIGSEQFSTANDLDQDIYTLTDNFKWYKGSHTFTIGTHNEFSSFYNLFIPQNYGVYEFSSIQSFINGDPATNYFRSYSLVDDVTGDGSAAAADFSAMQLGFYIQDEWAASRNFTVTGGLRVDIPVILDDPEDDGYFNEVAREEISQYYDLQGAEAGKMPEGQLMFSPRLGFKYNFMNNGNTILRGGLGVFTSRIPFVWPGGAYTNNGLTLGTVNASNIEGDIEFRPDIDNQYTNENFTVPSGQMHLFSENFKYPQLFRTNLALDHELPGGIFATIEGIYSKTINNIYYQNVNNDPTVNFNWTNGPIDTRPVFFRRSIDPTYSEVYLATNTDEGYSWNITASLAKEFSMGLQASVAYSYGDAYSYFEGTSSQNSSQWRGSMTIDGRNEPIFGRSDFAAGHRVVATLGYVIDWTRDDRFNTTLSFYYNGASGNNLYSYVYGGSSARNINNETGSTSRNRSLVYIPRNQSEIRLVDYTTSDGNTVTAADQWIMLNNFIQNDEYLRSRQGNYAERNSSSTPFENEIDFRLLQDVGVNVGGKTHKLQFSIDIFNFANLLNKDWGVVYNNYFEGAYEFIQFAGYAPNGTTPQFTFRETRTGNERFDINDRLSRWRMRLGVRYIFN